MGRNYKVMNRNHLSLSEGRLAFDIQGTGPLVVCVPGMGELRQSFRYLVPLLVVAGLRVATLDLRGHGDSDATFSAYDDVALASDILALVDHFGEPAVVVGNSMGAGAAAIAAAEAPEKIRALALLGPFVRDGKMSVCSRLLLRVALTGPWAGAAFMLQYPKWFPGERPDDYEDHRLQIVASLARPAHRRAFTRTTRTSHAPAEQALPAVVCPSAIIMGRADIDWPDPAREAHWIAEQLGSSVTLLDGVGHYPQAQAPAETADAILDLVEQLND